MSKKYYWLKMPKDFFRKRHVKLMEKKGVSVVLAYLKMLVGTLDTDNLFEYHAGLYDSLAEEIADAFELDAEEVKTVINILEQFNLIDIADKGCLFVEAVNLTGKETDSAERMRRLRDKQKASDASQCDGDVIKSDTEIEKETETEKETEAEEEKEEECREGEREGTNLLGTLLPCYQISAQLADAILTCLKYGEEQDAITIEETSLRALLKKAEEAEQEHGTKAVIKSFETMANGWKGVCYERIQEDDPIQEDEPKEGSFRDVVRKRFGRRQHEESGSDATFFM